MTVRKTALIQEYNDGLRELIHPLHTIMAKEPKPAPAPEQPAPSQPGM